MKHPADLLVFTDLDGTLLDHDTYAHDMAAPALRVLADRGVPVVLASSKTASEMAPLREALALSAYPAIVENGAGLLPPGDGVGKDALMPDYRRLRAVLDTVPTALRSEFVGFGDMGPARIAEVTGLSTQDAALAARRGFSEPGLWTGKAEARAQFLSALADRGVAARQGGRFLTLSFGATKADRIAEIRESYGAPFTIALGDAPNDVEMLESCDMGIVIANPHRPALPRLAGEAEGRIRRSTKPGPEGWNAEVLRIIRERA